MDEETRNVMQAGFNTLADLIRETNTELSATRTELSATRTELSARMDDIRDELTKTRQDLGGQIARVGALEQKAS